MQRTADAGRTRDPARDPLLRRVVLADALWEAGVTVLREAEGIEVCDRSEAPPSELTRALAEAEAVLVRSGTTVDAGLLDEAPRLRVIGRAGVGVDNIDVEEATRRGIAVLNAPGGNTRSTAELAFSLLLAVARRIPEADRSVRRGEWDRKGLRGVQLHGKTLGVVGLGRIGSEVTRRARAFGLRVVAHDPYAPPERAAEMGVELRDLDTLLGEADFVTLHAPLTDETEGMIGARELGRMKAGAFLVNGARGGLVDEAALALALRTGELAGAGLDVYSEEPLPVDSPLREAPNLVLTPHLGAATEEAKREVAVEIATRVRDALVSGDLGAALNAPRVARSSRSRAEPLLALGRSLGSLLSELATGRAREIRVSYAGSLEEVLRPLAAASVEGFLRRTVDRPLNLVNALHLAGERGIEVSRVRGGERVDYANYVELTAVGGATENRPGGGVTVGGALLAEGHPRIVRVDDFHVDTVPRGTLLVIRNRDVPGVIGEVGTRLGTAGVNIAEYHQARRNAGGEALAVVTVDGKVADDVLASLRDLGDVTEVRQVVFG